MIPFCERCGARPAVPGWKPGFEQLCRICIFKPDGPRSGLRRVGTRHRYLRANRCGRCGGEIDRPDRTRCKTCRDYEAATTARWVKRQPDLKPKKNVEARNRRQRRAAAGLCTDCGGERDRQDRLLCARCRKRTAAVEAKYRERHPEAVQKRLAEFPAYAKQLRQGRIDAGLCARCGGERDRQDRRNCAPCRERDNLNLRRRRERAANRADSPPAAKTPGPAP